VPRSPVYGLVFGLVDQLFCVVVSGVDRLAGATYVPFFFV
jgi:hypothetical protein